MQWTDVYFTLWLSCSKAKTFKSVKDFLTVDSDSPPMKEKLGLSFSVVKSIVNREKDKLNHEICGELEISSAVQVLFDSGCELNLYFSY